MDEFEKIQPLIRACLENSESLLNSAKEVIKPGQHHIAYHLAALALEEIGKASLFRINAATKTITSKGLGEDDSKNPLDWIDDHERKLFWALWLPNFGSHDMSVEQFREFQALARQIHELRLATLYISPDPTGARINDEDVTNLIRLTGARLEMEKQEKRAVDPAVQADLEWFFRATEHPFLKTVVMSAGSVAKLTEFMGDSRKWVRWLRETVEEMDRANRELAEAELQRPAPGEKEARKPRWEMTLRFKSGSHSIRPKPLAKWNGYTTWLKLYPTDDKKELLLKMTLPKGFLVNSLWDAGLHLSTLFILSLNIGAFGFFWWYLPSVVDKYYEKIVDLENGANLVLDTPSLQLNFGRRALNEAELLNVRAVLGHLLQVPNEQSLPYRRYFWALGLLAKSDLLGQLHHHALIEFSEALKVALTTFGDWDGKPDTLETGIDSVFGRFDEQFRTEVKRMLLLARDAAEKQTSVSTDDVIKMKAFCDTYFVIRLKRQREKDKEPAATSAP